MKKSLTWEQKTIVSHENGNALVKAVPGSGKTITLVKRVERLVKSGVDHRSILILMYNKSASQTFSDKLQIVLKSKAIPEVRTLHSLGLKLIREAEQQHLIKKKELIAPDNLRYAQIVNQSYREGFANETAFIPSEDIEDFELFITRCRAEGVTPDEAASDPTFNKEKPEHIRAYRRYCDLLEDSNLRTFDDCLLEANALLSENLYHAPRYKHIIVDEYQDVNLIQHTLIQLLAKNNTSVMAVGDINQCIYEWRGARPDFIGGLFEQHFQDTKVYHLSCTFRFGHALSLMANSVIRRNPGKLSNLCISHPSTPKTDVRLIAENCLIDVLHKFSSAQGTHAILSRTKASLAEAEMALRLSGVPFRYLNKGTSPLYKRAEVGSLVIGVLLCIYGDIRQLENHPNKKSLLQGFLREGGFKWGKGQLREALNRLMAPNADIWGILGSLFKGSRYQEERLERLAAIRWKDSGDGLAINVFRLLELAGYFAEVGSGGVTRVSANDKQRGIDKLEKLLDSSRISTVTFLRLMLSEEPQSENFEPFILATLHGSKGLEWDNVIMMGLQDSEFPGGKPDEKRSSHLPQDAPRVNEQSEEERRLFYVGITRAKRQLTLLVPDDEGLSKWLQNAWDSTPKRATTATRFVYEAGLTACALTSDAIYNRTFEKDRSSFSKFHQWYLRNLQRLRV